jgi:DUF1680 family protein
MALCLRPCATRRSTAGWTDDRRVRRRRSPTGTSPPRQAEGPERWRNLNNHRLYSMGHLLTAASSTAPRAAELSRHAIKVADICMPRSSRGRGSWRLRLQSVEYHGRGRSVSNHRRRKYLQLARTFVDMRGSAPGGNDQNQSRAAAEGGGGGGTRRYRHVPHEGAGLDYELPNRLWPTPRPAFNIAHAMWNQRLLAFRRRAARGPRSWSYNSMLSGMGVEGGVSATPTRCAATGRNCPASSGGRAPQRTPTLVCYCCPTNVAASGFEGVVYAKSAALWVNLYGGSRVETAVAGGRFALAQRTDTPGMAWSRSR